MMICCGVAVKSVGMVGEGVKELTVKMERVALIGEG
jgi:hypothetical protein